MTLRRYLPAGLLVGVAGVAALVALRWVPTMPPPPPDYRDGAAWLCRPGRTDACGTPMTATIIQSDGSKTIATLAPDAKASVDCFYLYPTVSHVRRAYSPIVATADEQQVARQQLAPFSAVCRPFAPLYRQVTMAGLPALFRGHRGVGLDVPYADVLAAWKDYLARDNGGRRVVLIGHSQGSRLLAKLIAAEIDGKAIQSQVLAAVLPGATIEVPEGRNVGGTFKSMPLCRPGDSGCVIAYSAFPARQPIPSNAHFGRTGTAGTRYACVNPSDLAGTHHLDANIPLTADLKTKLGTDFVELPGAITASCRSEGGVSILAIDIGDGSPLGEPTDALIARAAQYHPTSGYHVLDLELASGTLAEIIGRMATHTDRKP